MDLVRSSEMESAVKVFFSAGDHSETRYFCLNKNTNMVMQIRGKVQSCFADYLTGPYKIYWKDSEGDYITVNLDDDLFFAMQSVQRGGVLKVYVQVIKQNDKEKPGYDIVPKEEHSFHPSADLSQLIYTNTGEQKIGIKTQRDTSEFVVPKPGHVGNFGNGTNEINPTVHSTEPVLSFVPLHNTNDNGNIFPNFEHLTAVVDDMVKEGNENKPAAPKSEPGLGFMRAGSFISKSTPLASNTPTFLGNGGFKLFNRTEDPPVKPKLISILEMITGELPSEEHNSSGRFSSYYLTDSDTPPKHCHNKSCYHGFPSSSVYAPYFDFIPMGSSLNGSVADPQNKRRNNHIIPNESNKITDSSSETNQTSSSRNRGNQSTSPSTNVYEGIYNLANAVGLVARQVLDGLAMQTVPVTETAPIHRHNVYETQIKETKDISNPSLANKLQK